MQNKVSDKSPTTTELDDNALDGVVGGGMNISGSGGFSIPTSTGGGSLPTGGGDGGGSSPSTPGGGDPFKDHTSGSFEPNSVHFPK